MKDKSPVEPSPEAPKDPDRCIKDCTKCELWRCGNAMRKAAKYGNTSKEWYSPYAEDE